MINSIRNKIHLFLIIIIVLTLVTPIFALLNLFSSTEFANNNSNKKNTLYQPDQTQLNLEESFTRGLVIDLTFHKNDLRTINEDRVFGNVTVRDDATLNIKDCEVEILGKLKVMGNGRIFITNSNVTIAPGPVDPHEIIINFSDNAKVRIENSNIYTYPQPTLTNISYLLSDDTSEVTIIKSYLNFKLPAILNMDIELTPPTAGTFILTGETSWNIIDCKVEGFLRIVPVNGRDTLLGRWFLFTLQQSAYLYMKNTNGFMNDHSQPFIKPVAGKVKLENCRVPQGVIDVEVIAEFEAINLTIVDLNFRDQSKSRIISSTIINTLDLGSLAIVPPGAGSLDLDETDTEKPKSRLYIEDSSIGDKLLARGNSSTEIIRSTIDRCLTEEEAKLLIIDSEIKTLIDIAENSYLKIENTTLPNINMAGRSRLDVNHGQVTNAINKITTKFNFRGDLIFQHSKIKHMEVFGGDAVPPNLYGPWYDPNRNVSKVTLTMKNSTIDVLKTEDDAELYLILQDSAIGEFDFKKFKNESVIISILNISSKYTIPQQWPDIDLKFLIYHKIEVEATVNGQPVTASISVTNNDGEEIISKVTSEQGKTEFELLYNQYSTAGQIVAGKYSIVLKYLGFLTHKNTTAERNEEISIQWEDHQPPTIGKVDINTDFQRTKRGTRISAKITDAGVKIIANATIHYQYRTNGDWNDGESISMIEVSENMFEGEIPQLPQGAEVQFYITVEDKLGNKVVSEKFTYKIPNTDFFMTVTILLFLLVIFILALLVYHRRRKRFRKYLNKPKENLLGVKNEFK